MNEDKSTRYQRAQRTVFWIRLWLFAAGLALLVPAGGAQILRNLVVGITGLAPTSPLAAALFGLILAAANELAALPAEIYRASIDRRYGTTGVPLIERIRDELKGSGLASTLAAAGTFVVYFNLSHWPKWWWLITALLAVAVSAVLVVRTNRSFFAGRPLARADLRARLEALAARAGVSGLQVYEWMPDARKRRANAMLTASGAACRVLVSEALLADFTADEIEMIVAHELGHHVHRDVRTARLMRAALVVATGGFAAAVLSWAWKPLGLLAPNDAAGFPLLLLAAGLVVLLTQPLLNAWSRRREYRADQFALALTRRPDVLVSVLRRLADRHLAETRPSHATVWLFHSHPSVAQRIEAARTFGA